MPMRPCLTCGEISPASRCPKHTGAGGAGWSGGRDRAALHRFRAAVLAEAGGRCQGVDAGKRCPATTGLQAHHTGPTDDPRTGLALCRRHHRARDQFAR